MKKNAHEIQFGIAHNFPLEPQKQLVESYFPGRVLNQHINFLTGFTPAEGYYFFKKETKVTPAEGFPVK